MPDPTPEQFARRQIDLQLSSSDWVVQDAGALELKAFRGVSVREVAGDTGRADYVLYLDGKACGIIEAKRADRSLEGVQEQSGAYAAPDTGKLFPEVYNVYHLGAAGFDPVNQVVISTIQRLFAQL